MTAAHISPNVFSLQKFLSNIQELFLTVHDDIIHTYYTSHLHAHLHLLFYMPCSTSLLQIFMAGWLPSAPCVLIKEDWDTKHLISDFLHQSINCWLCAWSRPFEYGLQTVAVRDKTISLVNVDRGSILNYFWWNISPYCIYSPLPLLRGQPSAKCHPKWQPILGLAVLCRLGRLLDSNPGLQLHNLVSLPMSHHCSRGSMHVVEHHDDLFSWKKYYDYIHFNNVWW